MAKSIVEQNPDLKVVETNIDEGAIPFCLIDDEYGISCDEYCYSLVRKKRANRKITNDEGEEVIEKYNSWAREAYCGTIFQIVECYADYSLREKLKDKQFMEVSQVAKTVEEMRARVRKFTTNFIMDANTEYVGKLEHQRAKLLQEIEDLIDSKEKLKEQYEELADLMGKTKKLMMEKK